MNIDELKRLSKMSEGPRLEFKLSAKQLSKDLWETVSAFANTDGGLILLGFRSTEGKHVLEGVVNAEKLLDDFSSTISEKFNFCPLVKTEIIKLEGKNIIAIEVAQSPEYQKPLYVKDAGPLKGGHKRIGAADIRLSDHDVHRFYLSRSGSPDSQVCDGAGIEDLDPVAVSGFRELRKLEAPNAPELKLTDEELLKSYQLMDEAGKLNVAGVLLFGKERVVKKHFPAFRLDIIRIKGLEWGKDRDPFLSRDLKGNLMYLRTAAIDFIEQFFLVPFKSDYKGDRVGDNAYLKMLREALTNLLMHQDFYRSNPSQVIIYNDRIEYYNPGQSLKDPELFRSPGSVLRNPLIASVFYDINWAETKGTGIRTAIIRLKEEGYNVPEFLNDRNNDRFIVSLAQPFGTPDGADRSAEPFSVSQPDETGRLTATLRFCEIPRNISEILDFLGLKDRKYIMKSVIKPLLDEGVLRRTLPDKPNSRFQKYIAVRSKQ